MTFDRLTDAIAQFTPAVGLARYSLYMFDAHEDEIRAGALSLEGKRTQYVEGTPDPSPVNRICGVGSTLGR